MTKTNIKLNATLKRVLSQRGIGNDWLVDSMDAAIEVPQVDPRASGWMHASLLDHPCDRYVGYTYAGVRFMEKTPAITQRRFRTGEAIEARIIDEIRRADLLVEAGVTHTIPEYKIRFTPDAIIHHPMDVKDIYVLEIKSANNNSFKGKKDNADPSHVSRTNFYMGGLGISKGLILYENKDSHAHKVHFLDLDSEKFEEKKKRAMRIHKEVDAGARLTPIDPLMGYCSNCPFREPCFAEVAPAEAPKMLDLVVVKR